MEAARQIFPEIPDIVLDFPARRPARLAVEKRQFKFNTFIMVLIVLSTAGVARVCQNALIAQNGIDIARLEHQIKEDKRTNKGLKVERMLLQSPGRLERLAVRRLDMVKPENVNLIVIPVASARTEKKVKERPARAGRFSNIVTKASLLVR